MLRSQTKSPPNFYKESSNLKTEFITQTDYNTYEVKSMTNKNKSYEVTILDKDIAACECPDFTYRQRTCKHIAEVLFKVMGEI